VMRCAQGDMGDSLTAAARPAPRPIKEREQSCLIAGYRIRAERCSYVLSRAWTAFRWPIFFGLANEDCGGL